MSRRRVVAGLSISSLAAAAIVIGFVRALVTEAQWWMYWLLSVAAIVPCVVAMASLGVKETKAPSILMTVGVGMVLGGIASAAAGIWTAVGVLVGSGIMNMIVASNMERSGTAGAMKRTLLTDWLVTLLLISDDLPNLSVVTLAPVLLKSISMFRRVH